MELQLVNAFQKNNTATPHWVEMKEFAHTYADAWGLDLSTNEDSFLVAQQIARQPKFVHIISRVKPWVMKGLSMEERVMTIAQTLKMSINNNPKFGDIGFRTEVNEKISKKISKKRKK